MITSAVTYGDKNERGGRGGGGETEEQKSTCVRDYVIHSMLTTDLKSDLHVNQNADTTLASFKTREMGKGGRLSEQSPREEGLAIAGEGHVAGSILVRGRHRAGSTAGGHHVAGGGTAATPYGGGARPGGGETGEKPTIAPQGRTPGGAAAPAHTCILADLPGKVGGATSSYGGTEVSPPSTALSTPGSVHLREGERRGAGRVMRLADDGVPSSRGGGSHALDDDGRGGGRRGRRSWPTASHHICPPLILLPLPLSLLLFGVVADLKLLAQLLDVPLGGKLGTDGHPRHRGALVQTHLGLDGLLHRGEAQQGQLGGVVGVAHSYRAKGAAHFSQGCGINLRMNIISNKAHYRYHSHGVHYLEAYLHPLDNNYPLVCIILEPHMHTHT